MVDGSYISHQWPHPARKQVLESCWDEAPRAESQLCVITVLASDACTDEVLGHRRMSVSAQVGLYWSDIVAIYKDPGMSLS